MSTKPETQVERAELIRKLNSYAHAIERFGNTNVSQAVKEAAALLADGKAGGEPFCWAQITSGGIYVSHEPDAQYKIPLYARPQPAAQVAQPLTENVIDIYIMQNKLMDQAWPTQKQLHQFARDVAAHRIGKDQV